ncbi:MAG TPA: Holliday junction resolvase RuvX [Candidatus Kapabacteria bacterium]|nr:Holliday junction resolvase RuvX [Candidatus Kapabacteria bacterium]
MTDRKTPSRVLALDYGTKRIGIAISDELRILASPRGTIASGPAAIGEIVALARREEVGTVLLGIPRTLANTHSAMTAEVIRFHDKLAAALTPLGIALEQRDERLTSLIAETNIRSRELPKQKREQKYLRDEEAARILLQEYLDEHSAR